MLLHSRRLRHGTRSQGCGADQDELVSPGNKTMDRKFKPLLYAEAAIPHFWRLEFEPAPRLIVSELHGGRYVETVTALAGTTTRIDAPFLVDIDPAGLARQ
ncbi:hypothetical protein OG985_49655 (plasmid) [Streptomyces sp. NBC_00289]|uniref:hypothetical protein n=1 Tax=Streptomyces sp. NBC_00289 TaxID=2975703 RepID=UPI002F915AB0